MTTQWFALIMLISIVLVCRRLMNKYGPQKMDPKDELNARVAHHMREYNNRKNTTGYKIGTFVGKLLKED